MRMYPRTFPATRAAIPERGAERRIYEGLAQSAREGFTYYEWRRGYGRIEVDFAVWVEGVGRFALQVKGGRYLLIDGEWHLNTRMGLKAVDTSPLDEAWLGALDLHDDIAELADTDYNPFVTAVLALPDMELDQDMVNLARRKAVHLLWRGDDPVQALEEMCRLRSIRPALNGQRIAREVLAVTDGMFWVDAVVHDHHPKYDHEPDPRHVFARPGVPTVLSLSAGGLDVLRVNGGFNLFHVRRVTGRS